MVEPPAPPGESATRSPRGRRTPLTRQQVLSAALALVDREGLDALTMRRLGQELGRDPMALYRYAANRTELLDGVAELVLEQLVITPTSPLGADPGRADGGPMPSWQDQLRRTARDFRTLALAHPHVVPLLVIRPLSTPLALRPVGTLRPLEEILGLLIDAGFDPVDALHICRAYFGFLYGHVLTELQELVADPEETEDLLRLGLHRLPARRFPHMRALATALAGYDGGAELERGLDILMAGLDAQLHTTDIPLQTTTTRTVP